MTKKIINDANGILADYCTWLPAKALQDMYERLNQIGISIGLVTDIRENNHGFRSTADVYYCGALVEGVSFMYGVYSDLAVSRTKNEYTFYIS